MKRVELIKEIIKLQKSKPNIFIEVAKESDLERMTIGELNMIYNASYLAK